MDGDRLIYGAENGLSRRSALTGVALGTTFALAVQPVQAQTMIVTPADGLTAGAVKVKTKDGKEIPIYRLKVYERPKQAIDVIKGKSEVRKVTL